MEKESITHPDRALVFVGGVRRTLEVLTRVGG